MKNLLSLAALVVLSFAVVGWYLNWYQIKTAPSEEGRHQVTIDFNSPKITQDLREGKDRVAKILDNNGDGAKQETQQASTVPDFPTFVNPLPQTTKQPQPQQNNPPPGPPLEFQITEDGFFVIPSEFFPAESPQTPGR